ncbi:spermidine acetyltransferase [Lysinibacillus sphaericus]|uniref:GNAT family N-acetyltransferase n=1 Tax=Lysinibacillus sphaericus TaxID=1421 RepID=UPI0018CF33C6|nr:GNAT family N-acetyltransferase [Lysinibacillus sphaericus]MBG9455592.1 spermidine acetyltransferase [Lysinibacillus sphaericus]MBG9478009.1 spermidine acetyltransferase [Lysinibacillus sphaericus]MBG9594149.1 spermidine acetyltransferase [Lysinibacillus sphaericus]
MSKNSVKIVEVNAENWYECCLLEISKEQRNYIEPNAISIVQSKFELTLKPYVIYFEEKVVGFLMFNSVKEELDGYWIYRIMIDKHFQGKGIGKAATRLMISEIAKLPNAQKVIVGYHPENKDAHNLYSSLGFKDYGDRFGKEMAVIKYLHE